MSEQKHTPGPWHVKHEPMNDLYEVRDRKYPICGISNSNNKKANAELIARAPELLQQVAELTKENEELTEEIERNHEQLDRFIDIINANDKELSRLREENENLKQASWEKYSGQAERIADLDMKWVSTSVELTKAKIDLNRLREENKRILKHFDKKECDQCDGCGWYEGGPTIKTTCETCEGTGVIYTCNHSVEMHLANIKKTIAENQVKELVEALREVLPYLSAVGTNGNHYVPKIQSILSKFESNQKLNNQPDENRIL